MVSQELRAKKCSHRDVFGNTMPSGTAFVNDLYLSECHKSKTRMEALETFSDDWVPHSSAPTCVGFTELALGRERRHGWLIHRVRQTVARPLVGRVIPDSAVVLGKHRILRPTRGRATDTATSGISQPRERRWLGGGGVNPGIRFGETDDDDVKVKTHLHDLHATMLHRLGFDHTKLTYRYAGRDVRLADAHRKVISGLLA